MPINGVKIPETMSTGGPADYPLFAPLFHDGRVIGKACLIAHRLPDVVDVVANHYLKLAAAFDHHDDARVFLEPFRIRPLILFQFEAKPGRAVYKTFDDVLFPPTWPRISFAKAWYSISISLHPMPAGTC